jgi:iron complex transport system ATP-binding protein
VIDVRDVTKTYGETRVLDGVSVRLNRGGLTSLIGPNGAGKSTLLSVISRLAAPTSGQVLVNGLDVARTPSAELARRLSILRQENHITARLTVRDLVSFGRYPHSQGRRLTPDDRDQIEQALDYLTLRPMADRFLDELSGGQRQRAFVAMVLAQDTDYILLDEPLNNLDMRNAVSIMGLLRNACDKLGKTVVIVLHDINFASCYSDHILAMKDGRARIHAPAAEVMKPDVLQDIFGFDIPVHEIGGRSIAVYFRSPASALLEACP